MLSFVRAITFFNALFENVLLDSKESLPDANKESIIPCKSECLACLQEKHIEIIRVKIINIRTKIDCCEEHTMIVCFVVSIANVEIKSI